MSDTERYSKLAAIARTSAIKLDRAGRTADANKARADAIRYSNLTRTANQSTMGAAFARAGIIVGK